MSAIREKQWGLWFLFLSVYAALTFAQEYVRAVTQGGLSFFYRTAGQPDRWKALLIANIVFAILHVHLSPVFAVLAFAGGLGIPTRKVLPRQAAVSHLVIGTWVVFIVGIAYEPTVRGRMKRSGLKPNPPRTRPRPAGWVGLYARQRQPNGCLVGRLDAKSPAAFRPPGFLHTYYLAGSYLQTKSGFKIRAS